MAIRPRQPDGRVHGVIAGIRRGDDRWLCIRRSEYVAAPLKVCFPGGAMEAGETQEIALVRELREELGVVITPDARVWNWESPSSELTLWGWRAGIVSGALKLDPFEVAEILWLTSAEAIAHPDAMPTNRDFVVALEAGGSI